MVDNGFLTECSWTQSWRSPHLSSLLMGMLTVIRIPPYGRKDWHRVDGTCKSRGSISPIMVVLRYIQNITKANTVATGIYSSVSICFELQLTPAAFLPPMRSDETHVLRIYLHM